MKLGRAIMALAQHLQYIVRSTEILADVGQYQYL